LIHLDFVHMLILVSTTVFVSVYTPLVAILFGASAQLVSSGLLSSYGGGRAVEREDAQRTIATSKTSVASRLEYDIHLPGSGRDREL
jgi:hypothetical protein